MPDVLLYDPTLRDGNHAVKHQLGRAQLAAYARAVNAAGVPMVEVGHGNGLGASSLQVGLAKMTDHEMVETVKAELTTSRLAAFLLPGWGTIADVEAAVERGADLVRLGAHCTESDLTERHLGVLAERGIEAHGCLLMSHMAPPDRLAEECARMVGWGAKAVGIFDSSGHYVPSDVAERIGAIREAVDVPLLFHGHNNLGLAVANTVAAADAGATILDGCARGFGAGAGNTQLEVLVPVLERVGYRTGIDLYALLDAADLAEAELLDGMPAIRSVNVVSGLAGVFSAFRTQVEAVSEKLGVDPRDVFFELGRRQAVAGQEDLIVEVAEAIARDDEKPAPP